MTAANVFIKDKGFYNICDNAQTASSKFVEFICFQSAHGEPQNSNDSRDVYEAIIDKQPPFVRKWSNKSRKSRLFFEFNGHAYLTDESYLFLNIAPSLSIFARSKSFF